jgi:hypothetical protein
VITLTFPTTWRHARVKIAAGAGTVANLCPLN